MRDRDVALAAGVALAVLATRLPFLSAGFGSDPDAWRIVHAAQNVAIHHAYFVSRFPGFPIPEIAYALLPTRPVPMNGVTALFSALAAGTFAVLARRLGARHAVLAGLTFAATPVVWANSSVTMDYLWSLAFALAGLLALVAGRALVAGVAIGLAAGCRITAILFLVPALAFLLATRRPSRDAVRMVASSAVVTLVAFTPVLVRFASAFLRSGESFFEPAVRRIGAEQVVAMATIGVWGVVGCWTLVGACAWIVLERLRRRRIAGGVPAAGDPLRLAALLLCATGLVVFLLVYLRLPYDSGYLIPIVPFVVLALALLLGRRAMGFVAAGIALSGFVSVSARGITRGKLLEDLRSRRSVASGVEAILAEGDRLTAPTVVVSRAWFPAISVLLGERGCGDRGEAEAGERRRITCGSTLWVKTLTPLDAPKGEVLHLIPGGRRRILGPGFPYPERW